MLNERLVYAWVDWLSTAITHTRGRRHLMVRLGIHFDLLKSKRSVCIISENGYFGNDQVRLHTIKKKSIKIDLGQRNSLISNGVNALKRLHMIASVLFDSMQTVTVE